LALADHVLFLASGGRQAYFGTPSGMPQHFEAVVGRAPTTHETVVEWVAELLSWDSACQWVKCVEAWEQIQPQVKSGGRYRPMPAGDGWGHDETVAKIANEVVFLTRRGMLNTIRNKIFILLRVVSYSALSVMVGTVWWRSGAGDFNSVSRVLAFVPAFMAFMSISVMPAFLEELHVFLKERLNHNYGMASYSISSVLANMPSVLLLSGCSTAILYPCLQLNTSSTDKVFIFFVNLFVTLLCAESAVYMIAAFTRSLLVGIAVVAMLFCIFMMAEGLFIQREDLPSVWWWVHYLGFQSYSFRNFMVNEFSGRLAESAPFHDDQLGVNVGVMLTMAIFYRIIGFLSLIFIPPCKR